MSQNHGMKHTLLFVDDDSTLLQTTTRALQDRGYEVHAVKSGEDAIELLKSDPHLYALVILDHELPGISGSQTARALWDINKDLFILMYSKSSKIPFKTGNIQFIEKAGDPSEFFRAVENWCLKFDETMRILSPSDINGDEPTWAENIREIESIGLKGRSDALAEIARRIKKYEREGSEPDVLITGETGTGKECIAKALHERSSRKNYPFIAINCGALSPGVIESELFGHERGSFTGAATRHTGKFKVAHRGTIFLDEIGDTSLEFQVKLLRVLQEREFSPVGSNEIIKVDVRVITATHKDLEKAILEGKFREDLYYRIKGVQIVAPPLRERPEDIAPLILHLCNEYNKKKSIKKGFLRETIRLMERFPWNGNVRELRATVEQYLTDSDESKISPKAIEGKFFEQPSSLAEAYSKLQYKSVSSEREFFKRVRKFCSSQRDAAEKLGIPASTIVGILKRLGLPTTFEGKSDEIRRAS